MKAPTDRGSAILIGFGVTCAGLSSSRPSSHGASRDEQERVDGEIREDAIVRTWIDAVAPDLREDLARRVGAKHVRVEVPSYEEDERDEESEEAEAAARLSSSS